MLLDLVTSVFLLLGAAFALIGSIGLWRLPDFYTRLHGPTKATTLGVGGILVAWTVHFGGQAGELSLGPVLISFFLFLTAPIGAHLMSRAALHIHLHTAEGTRGTSLVQGIDAETTVD